MTSGVPMETGLQGKKVALVGPADAPAGALDAWRAALEECGAVAETLGADSAPAASLDYEALVAIGGDAERTADRAQRGGSFPEPVVQLVREMAMVDKPLVAVGTAVRLLVAADAVRGRTVAGPDAMRAEVEEAGGHWGPDASASDGRVFTAREAGASRELVSRIVGSVAKASGEMQVDRLSEQSFPASDPPPGPSAIGGTGAST